MQAPGHIAATRTEGFARGYRPTEELRNFHVDDTRKSHDLSHPGSGRVSSALRRRLARPYESQSASPDERRARLLPMTAPCAFILDRDLVQEE